jgi:tyrosyl-tRNA synthetase
LNNYIGITDEPQEMFGKIMSISDEMMWRYYELLTDLRAEEIAHLRASAATGERNPRDLKVELAKRIITDFHSQADANAAEEDFTSKFVRKEIPQEIEERTLEPGPWGLAHLLVEIGLATSKAEAKRLIQQGGVYMDGERCTVPNDAANWKEGMTAVYKVGPRRFVRVMFKHES